MRAGIVSAGLIAASVVLGLTAGANAQDREVKRSGNTYYVDMCPRQEGLAMHCMGKLVTDARGVALESKPGGRIAGYGAPDLRAAYNITTDGSSTTTVAIVDAFGYDNAEADLGVYRAQYSIPACTTANGCFQKLNQKGKAGPYPDQNNGWAGESALDVDMVSAMCPNCHIILVEANTNSLKNLAASVDTAVGLGAHVVSNSYAGGDSKGAMQFEPSYDHPGVAITASSDDAGYGAATPATMPHVVAVGGTHLMRNSSPRGWTETAWAGAGSGCSKRYAKPSWQTDKGCKMRMEADVSAVADPATAVAFYGPNNTGTSGWHTTGGTSVSAPLIGGIFGNNGGAVNDASTLYAAAATFNDVTLGHNGTCKGGKKAYYCNAEVGYDGPTGIGTPNGNAAFGN